MTTKLSDLIKIKTRASKILDFGEMESIMYRKANRVTFDLPAETSEELVELVSNEAKSAVNVIQELFEKMNGMKINVMAAVNESIEAVSKELKSKNIFPAITKENFDTARDLRMHDLAETSLSSRISRYSTWEYPGLEINPRNPIKITKQLVASEPLYLAELEVSEVLIHAKLIFPQLFQDRMRTYFIKENDFSVLPQSEFGFIICVNSFEFMTEEQIDNYLELIFPLLREGGTFLFTYNNCETLDGARQCDEGNKTYSTFTHIAEVAKKVGYEMAEHFDVSGWEATSWVELRKPGVLSTIKAAPTMGVINEITVK
jgi:SAM-dependent methyltransferase